MLQLWHYVLASIRVLSLVIWALNSLFYFIICFLLFWEFIGSRWFSLNCAILVYHVCFNQIFVYFFCSFATEMYTSEHMGPNRPDSVTAVTTFPSFALITPAAFPFLFSLSFSHLFGKNFLPRQGRMVSAASFAVIIASPIAARFADKYGIWMKNGALVFNRVSSSFILCGCRVWCRLGLSRVGVACRCRCYGWIPSRSAGMLSIACCLIWLRKRLNILFSRNLNLNRHLSVKVTTATLW